jgi:NADH-ubiquinone oxidoreductase chain 5
MNHAFFKALLFLSAGSVIHALADEQDMRKMGGVVKLLPFTYAMMFIGSLALIGFPFLTGFYSKDVILEVAYAKYTIGGNFAYWLGVLSALFTSYYSFRLLFLTFLGPVNSFKANLKDVHEAPQLMAWPLIILAFGSIFVGYMAKDMMIGLGTPFWNNALFILPVNTIVLESEYIPQSIKFIPIVFSVLGALFALNINIVGSSFAYMMKTSFIGRKLYIFLNKRWLFDKVYNDYIASKALSFGYHTSFKTLDKGFIEIIGPAGIMEICTQTMRQVSRLQSGYIYHYAFLMLCGVGVCIILVSFWDIVSPWVDPRIYGIFVLSFIFFNHARKTS